jgi:tellurite methyltransferase
MNSTGHTPENPPWNAYYEAVAGRPPRETLIKALAQFDAEPFLDRSRFAVDLGCGEGRDTAELLARGWQVLAIDGEEKAFEQLRQRLLQGDRLQTQTMRFEDLTLPAGVDLIIFHFVVRKPP